MTKQTPRQRKALRSAAARKGWETRRALSEAMERRREARQASMRPFMRSAEPVQSDPNPWPRFRAWIRKLVGR